MNKKKIGKLHPVIPNILYRNQVSLLGATPYAGKSRMCLRLAAQLAEGKETMFGRYAPMKVLYCSERDWDFTTTQFAEQGYTYIPDNLEFLCVPNIPKAAKAAFRLNPLAYVAKEMFVDEYKPDVTILDTIADFQNVTAQLKTADYGANRMSIMNIQQWAIEHYLAILALAHSPKENEHTRYRNPIQRVFGSISIVASTAAVFILEPIDPEKPDYLKFYQKSHLAKLEPVYRYFHADDYREVSQEEAESTHKGQPLTALTPREIDILEAIPITWSSYSDTVEAIKSKLELNDTNVFNYLKRLVNKSQIAIDHNPENPTSKLIRRFKPN